MSLFQHGKPSKAHWKQHIVRSCGFGDNGGMEDQKNTKPTASEDYEQKSAENKNMDRDGTQNQPIDHKEEPTK